MDMEMVLLHLTTTTRNLTRFLSNINLHAMIKFIHSISKLRTIFKIGGE
jgi:hypothetical protein